MGWKSTIDITVSEAKCAIAKAEEYHRNKSVDDIEYLERRLDELGVGDIPDLPYFGHNFHITSDDV